MADAFRHLLVPVDFTDQNQDALEVARKLAQQHHARVTLLHVIETIDYVADEEIDQFYETLKRRESQNDPAGGALHRGTIVGRLSDCLGKAGEGS